MSDPIAQRLSNFSHQIQPHETFDFSSTTRPRARLGVCKLSNSWSQFSFIVFFKIFFSDLWEK